MASAVVRQRIDVLDVEAAIAVQVDGALGLHRRLGRIGKQVGDRHRVVRTGHGCHRDSTR
ncbi:MAG: hypothetical protein ACRDN9_18290 [Streptosporangiaceae bacterium]